MLNRSFVDRHSRLVLSSLPACLPSVIGACVVIRVVQLLAGNSDAAPSTTNVYLCYIVPLLLLSLMGVGVYYIHQKYASISEVWKESQSFVERIWAVAKDGPGSTSLVGDDLGKPDSHGVYTRKTREGAKLYLRMARGSMSGEQDLKVWQWSFDRRSWIATAKIDQFCNTTAFAMGMAETILIRRLEIESAFREKHPCLHSSVQTPAIDFQLSKDEEQKRLNQSVPRGFLCPISMELMTQPVVSPSGITYDRKSLASWIHLNHSDPATQAPLKLDHLYPNLALRDMIQEWLVDHNFIGTEK